MPPTRSTFLSTSASLGAAVLFPRTAAAQAKPPDLRIASNSNDSFAAAYYAQDSGLFAQAGLTVDLQSISNGAAITAAVVGQAADIGVAVPITVASAYLHGIPLVIVATGSISSAAAPTTRLAVLANSPIKAAKDLEGKVVAINSFGSGLDLSLDIWLDKEGADKTKVKLVELPFSEMGAALEKGTIAGAILAEPAYTVASKQYRIRMLVNVNAAVAPEYVTSCWFTTRPYAEQHPDLIRRFVRVIYAAQTWANSHHDATAAILAKYSKLDLALVRSMSRAVFAEQLRPDEIQVYLDIAAKYGALPKAVSVSSFIYQPQG